MAGPLELVAAARLHHPAPELLVVSGGEAFPVGHRRLPPHVHALLDAEVGRATGDVSRALAVFADDAEFHGDGRGALAGPWHGPEGVRQFFVEWMSVWDGHEGRLELAIDCGHRVVTRAVQRARSRAAGIEVEMVNWGSWWFRGGKVVLVRFFESMEEALEADR